MKRQYARLLAKGSDFVRDDAVDVEFTYDFDDPRLAALEAKRGLREIAGEGDTQARALNLLHWLCAHTRHGNPQSMPEDRSADGLLDWSFDKPGNDPNCMHLSAILSECLLAVGARAYPLWCLPKVYKGDNHVVVQVWLPEESRWIMLDPSWDVYVTDETDRILDAPTLRQGLAGRAILHQNAESKRDERAYLDYMAKDMHHFYRQQDTRCGILQGGRPVVYLCPAGYKLEKEQSPVYVSCSSFWG